MITSNANHYLMPAEWAPHARTLIAWPCRESLWGPHLDRAKQACRRLVIALARYEPVTLLINPRDATDVTRRFSDAPNHITLLEIDLDDSWIRDNGPTHVFDSHGRLTAVRWIFNAWGNKYYPYSNDGRAPERIAQALGIPLISAPLVMEGGAISVDGRGNLITTESVLLNPNRNPSVSKADVECLFERYLGARHIIWLPRGLRSDETDGHVDNLACFVGQETVIALTTNDHQDENYETLQHNVEVLRSAKSAEGKPINVVVIPQPDPLFSSGNRLTASYVNLYFVNGAVLVPVFRANTDREALGVLSSVISNRSVVPVESRDLLLGGGAIHCMTQQLPANSLATE
jgi:agmatine deiminase